MGGYVALTGVPGTGKSAVGRALAAPTVAWEVGALALRTGTGRGRPGDVEVDMRRLARWVRAHPARGPPTVLVGHLAHLLPIRDAVVLRCHPVELLARLRRARRGTASDRRENVIAEATDVILGEALRERRRVWEVDTTGRSVADVAREVDRIVRDRTRPGHGAVAWLSDPLVTDYLLPALR
jgi:adenylate kinase